MKNTLFYYAILTALALITLQPAPLHSTRIYVLNSESRTLSSIDTDTDQVQTTFASLGIIPNKFVLDQDYIWCVNSGDNAVQKINRQTGSTVANILVEAACNPWDACLAGDNLFVTGMFTDKVYKIDTTTNAVVDYLGVGTAPEAMCIYNGKLYVTNTGGYQNNYAGSSVSVIDLSSWQIMATIPVSANPQYIVAQNGLLHVSCTGNWVNIPGKVCVIDPAINEVIQTITLGGSLGGIWLSSQHQGLVGDESGINLYRYDTTDYSIINDVSNPLTAGGSVVDGNAEMVAVLAPNWGSNGKVRIMHPDLSFWKEYNVGMAPTDMKLWQVPTPNEDEVNPQLTKVYAYPNPVRAGKSFYLSRSKTEATPLSTGVLRLYNLKGQLVLSQKLDSVKADVSTHGLARGCYLYQVRFATPKSTNRGLKGLEGSGKLVILD